MREIKYKAYDKATDSMWEVQTLDKPIDGRGAHNFKGYEKRNGYIARKVLSHPRADGRNYVLEHRLLMEQHLGRFLEEDEIVHHKNHVRDDNRIENLGIYTDQKRHAAAHAVSMERNQKSQQWEADPELSRKKFRFFNRDTGLMEIKNLSQLINTTFRKGKFEYRGESTGLKDKNGKEIYEGDIVMDSSPMENPISRVLWDKETASFVLHDWSERMDELGDCHVIGNIYENGDLLSD